MQYVAESLSRGQIRHYARVVRKAVRLENELMFPVCHFFEAFHKVIDDDDFYVEYVQDHELPADVHARYYVEDNCVRVKESIYIRAVAGEGRDRMTIVHEAGHVLLIKVSGIKLSRTFDDGEVLPYQDPEWQAKCFAGELLVPAHLVRGMSAQEVADKCGVSLQAARYQLSKIK